MVELDDIYSLVQTCYFNVMDDIDNIYYKNKLRNLLLILKIKDSYILEGEYIKEKIVPKINDMLNTIFSNEQYQFYIDSKSLVHIC